MPVGKKKCTYFLGGLHITRLGSDHSIRPGCVMKRGSDSANNVS